MTSDYSLRVFTTITTTFLYLVIYFFSLKLLGLLDLLLPYQSIFFWVLLLTHKNLTQYWRHWSLEWNSWKHNTILWNITTPGTNYNIKWLIFVPKDLKSVSNVFLQVDAVRLPLQQRFEEPYADLRLSTSSSSTIKSYRSWSTD